jgi:hypothetical protein
MRTVTSTRKTGGKAFSSISARPRKLESTVGAEGIGYVSDKGAGYPEPLTSAYPDRARIDGARLERHTSTKL